MWSQSQAFALCSLVTAVGFALPLCLSSASGQERKPDGTGWPFSSVGRVNVVTGSQRRLCTGTLIGPRHVLTAAHCLFDRRRQRWVHPTSVHFVAGYDRGEYKASAEAASYETGAGFTWLSHQERLPSAQDWGVIELAKPIDLKPIRVLPAGQIALPTDKVVLAGYRHERPHVLTIQPDCSTRSVSSSAPVIVLHNCSSSPGESGSALLSFEAGEPHIIGILIAATKDKRARLSIAVRSDTFATTVKKALGHSLW